jgi:hypothetical protein
MESAHTNKKEKKYYGSQEKEVRRMIFFCKNVSFYSMNSMQTENQSLKNRTQ